MGSFPTLAAFCADVRFSGVIYAELCCGAAVMVQRCLRLAVIPPIKKTDFFTCFDARNTADGFGRCANTSKFGQT